MGSLDDIGRIVYKERRQRKSEYPLGRSSLTSPDPLIQSRGSPAADCDHDCLAVTHNPAGVPVPSNLRATENGEPAIIGEGLWRTIRAIPYRQIFADASNGQVGMHSVADEGGRLAVLSCA
jgi:hypothetical protein